MVLEGIGHSLVNSIVRCFGNPASVDSKLAKVRQPTALAAFVNVNVVIRGQAKGKAKWGSVLVGVVILIFDKTHFYAVEILGGCVAVRGGTGNLDVMIGEHVGERLKSRGSGWPTDGAFAESSPVKQEARKSLAGVLPVSRNSVSRKNGTW